MPFRLLGANILSEDSPKVEKVDFYRKQLGEDGFTKMKDAITKWANENDIPMCVNMHFLRFFLHVYQ